MPTVYTRGSLSLFFCLAEEVGIASLYEHAGRIGSLGAIGHGHLEVAAPGIAIAQRHDGAAGDDSRQLARGLVGNITIIPVAEQQRPYRPPKHRPRRGAGSN